MSRKNEIKGAIYEQGYVYNFHYHLIWTTKYRKPLFMNGLDEELKEILTKIAKLNEITIETLEVMPDHIHLLISFKPKLAPTSAVKALIGGSARLFFIAHPEIKNSEFWGGHLWTRSYYMSTLGDMSKDIVEKYIDNQRNKG
jgi:putative transposase